MYLRQLTIQNFRNINKELNTISFEKGFNFLIGPYNSSKSTILLAINYLLDPHKPWWKNSILSKFDFFDVNEQLNIEAIICCEQRFCIEHSESDEEIPCNLFESNENELSCLFANKLARYFDLQEKKFLSFDELPEDESNEDNIVQAIKIRMIGHFNAELDYAEVQHEIENKNGEWKTFSQKMREWLNVKYYSGMESQSLQFQLTSRSALSKCLKDLDKKKLELKKTLNDSFRDPIYFDEFKQMFQENENLLKFQPEFKNIGLYLNLSRENDFFRQFELSVEENGKNIPFKYQGKGFRHISYLILSISNIKQDVNYPIVIIDDPEMSLEPQRQRGLINLIKRQLKKDSQMILTTHSPFILSPLLNLTNVSRITKNSLGKLTQMRLDKVLIEYTNFSTIRKKIVNDSNIYEALFGDFILLYEGDTESGFFPTYMGQYSENYSVEWFLGVNCQGSNILPIAKWLKAAGYRVLCVLDHDKRKNGLNDLLNSQINFLALPENFDFEEFIGTITQPPILTIENIYDIALNHDCSNNRIYFKPSYKKAKSIRESWPDLFSIMKELSNNLDKPDDTVERTFNSNNKSFDFSAIKEKIARLDKLNPPTLNFAKFLRRVKKKSNAHELAQDLSMKLDEIPELLKKYLDIIQVIFKYQLNGQFYIDETGEIKNYTRS